MSHNPPAPDRSEDLNALTGFQTPPPGYGGVPFWWWAGEDLDVERLLWQLRELHAKGISGVQVNYSHRDTPGWPTDDAEPKLFSEDWWRVYSRVSEECAKLGMGIGLSTYTLDWPNGADNLFYRLFYSKPELHARELNVAERHRLQGGEQLTVPRHDHQFAVRAYQRCDDKLQPGGIDLSREQSWTAPDGSWEVWTYAAVPQPGTLNPLLPGSGQIVADGFFQPFQDHNANKSAAGLNYFFNDELKVGLGKLDWHADFPEEFRARKGYDLLEVLPALWEDMGDITPKARIDHADVRMSLAEERYFEPIHRWHAEREIVYGCDNHGRGLQPDAYGDYFRATRWYTAPGHDTPGGLAHLIKGKVSSSIANLYELPRVQLEGYHSLGWGATTERIMEATCENYLYGCNMLSLHGCYYTTYGSHWEWAPPCFHFRMPYWQHMGVFLRYFERLSYLMSQGRHVCNVAVMYPVTPFEAEMAGDQARDVAFALGEQLMAAGINFDFIDHQSLAGGVSYKALVFPHMDAARWSSLEQAAACTKAGTLVLAVGAVPTASDHAGRNDAELAAINERAFPADCRPASVEEAVDLIRDAFAQDVCGLQRTVQAQHRKIGPRDVYMVMGAERGDVVAFRATGRVELWDPWTGQTAPLRVVDSGPAETQVELPLERYQAQIVVFTPGESHVNPTAAPAREVLADLTENAWRASFEPTMDNRWGDFRLPVTAENERIGLEARRFRWAREQAQSPEALMLPETSDSDWTTQLHGHGPKFYQLGPLPKTAAPAALDAALAGLEQVDPAVPVCVDGQEYDWQPYSFSWRFGREDDVGHQGFHGLKTTISDNFIRVGQANTHNCGVHTIRANSEDRYYLWSSVDMPTAGEVSLLISEPAEAGINASPVNAPAAIYVGGQLCEADTLSLSAGRHSVLLRYEDAGESHVVLRRTEQAIPEKSQELAMRWYADPGVVPFDPYAGQQAAEWFRFASAPGTTEIAVQAHSEAPVQAWIDGQLMQDEGAGRFTAPSPTEAGAVIALRVLPPNGYAGGAAIPEPIRVQTCGNGLLPLGDWAQQGILHNYSGGVRYRTRFDLTEEQATRATSLDLGRVVATAEVIINGSCAGVCVAPPWRVSLDGLLQAGENEIEVLVCNTLANHYQTIPSLYKGDPASGLFGPVRILTG